MAFLNVGPLSTINNHSVCVWEKHTDTHFAGHAHIFTQRPAAQEKELTQERAASADKEKVTPALIQHQSPSPFTGLIYILPRVLTHSGVRGEPWRTQQWWVFPSPTNCMEIKTEQEEKQMEPEQKLWIWACFKSFQTFESFMHVYLEMFYRE